MSPLGWCTLAEGFHTYSGFSEAALCHSTAEQHRSLLLTVPFLKSSGNVCATTRLPAVTAVLWPTCAHMKRRKILRHVNKGFVMICGAGRWWAAGELTGQCSAAGSSMAQGCPSSAQPSMVSSSPVHLVCSCLLCTLLGSQCKTKCKWLPGKVLI